LSPVSAVAAVGSGTARPRPSAGITVTTWWSALSGPSTTSEAVAASNTTAIAWPANGRTTPAGGVRAGGDTAASAGAIVGGGASAGFDVHAVTPHPRSTSTPQQAS
jgi:hypothetical protein